MLEWNVYVRNLNKNVIEPYNILSHPSVKNTIKECERKKLKRKDFIEEVRRCLVYLFWAKYEYEITLHSWPPHEEYEFKQIDAYDQIRLNWDVFCDYVWTNRTKI